jgi:UDP:flavonoid glycosyltransferase YjiC (YdhE family)
MHLLVAISHHGLGHLSQVAPVLNRLTEARPDLRLTVHSALVRKSLAARIAVRFEHIAEPVDCGMAMHDALRVDHPASLACYREFHRDWPSRVRREAERLRALATDAVLSNVAYLPLAAAQAAGLRSAAMCSIHWADIALNYLGDDPDMAMPLAQMREAYRGADLFLRPEPAMPMADLPNAIAIPPVAGRGMNRRTELLARLGAPETQRLILVTMGGIGYRQSAAAWPRTPGFTWLTPAGVCGAHPDCVALESLDFPHLDLLASCDALVTKPGYGSFVEAAVHEVPVLHLPRPDWPETPYLAKWIQANGRALQIEESLLDNAGELIGRLNALWRLPAVPPHAANGANLAVERLGAWLRA